MRPSALARSATASVGGIPREKSSALARPELHVVAELDELAADGLADDASPQNSDAHVSISSDVPKSRVGWKVARIFLPDPSTRSLMKGDGPDSDIVE